MTMLGEEPEDASTSATAATEPLKILVVDDEPAMVGALGALLGQAGHRIIAAYDGDEALRRFRDETLLASAAGRAFVRLYYRHSPPLADYIRERGALRAAVRGGLRPLVFAVKHPLAAGSLALSLLLLGWPRARAKLWRSCVSQL